jgi:hypothetical protein
MIPACAPIVFIGASNAAAWNLAPIAGHPVVNRAAGGHETHHFVARFECDVVAARPCAVLLWGYMNNLANTPNREGSRAEARVRDDYQRIIGKARAAGIELIVATDVLIGFDEDWRTVIRSWAGRTLGRERYEDYINQHMVSLNAWLRATATRERLLLLDLESVLNNARGKRVKAWSTPDGAHITRAGYDALTAYARPILEQHFTQRAAPTG